MVKGLLWAVALGLCSVTLHAAQVQPDSGAFVARLGSDTLGVERYVRTARALESEVVWRVPETWVLRLVVTHDGEGRVQRAEITGRRPGEPANARRSRRTVITFESDSAVVETTQDGSTRVRRVAGRPDMVPMLSPFYAPYDLMLLRARNTGADSVALEAVGTGGTVTYHAVRRGGTSEAAIADPTFGTRKVRLGRDGRMVEFQATGSPFGTIVQRVPWPDLEALAREFARRDGEGRALGALSPRDTVRATIHGAQILVDYGRPAKRGRPIFGGLVPWNEVWRTGANEATHFATDHNLRMGDTVIPAGTYTLWTLPAPTGWKLIINRRTRQWGTVYDEQFDLTRLDLRVDTLPEVVERLAISLEERGDQGALRIVWDRTAASIEFTVE
ncbi:MAG: DUF2911 domain-containing protein [Gemmatimonadetes bacterium]|nr:DUF2911 domain-containing protein [Gemmatimonadota bacterium]